MPSDASAAGPRHILGPVHVINTSISRQLFGFVLAFVAVSIMGWAAAPSTPITPRVLYTAIAGLVLYNGLYVGGVRLRESHD